ncbi:hypothetical protein M9H77_09025 [Catharanthus roseus]|uniref:Uncharacterized protein n=1 Tax=Catharanthus roseus TaxID=4058 RepID=A0ACC0BZL0_CATRO|nr:hypothetical protein M9H77_09025 [Catharanthus roseus]
MAAELADLVDNEGNVRPNMMVGIVKDFFESPAGGKRFYSLTTPMVSYALTKLVDAIYNNNHSVTMPSIMDMYYNKEAKCPRLPWNKVIDVDGSMSGPGDELFDGGYEGVESPLMTEVFREGNQSVLDTFDNVTVPNPEKAIVLGDEGLIGDWLVVDRPNVQSAIGSDVSVDRLGLRVSGGDQASDTSMPADTDVVLPAKPFGTVVGPGERSGRPAHLDGSLPIVRSG